MDELTPKRGDFVELVMIAALALLTAAQAAALVAMAGIVL